MPKETHNNMTAAFSFECNVCLTHRWIVFFIKCYTLKAHSLILDQSAGNKYGAGHTGRINTIHISVYLYLFMCELSLFMYRVHVGVYIYK